MVARDPLLLASLSCDIRFILPMPPSQLLPPSVSVQVVPLLYALSPI